MNLKWPRKKEGEEATVRFDWLCVNAWQPYVWRLNSAWFVYKGENKFELFDLSQRDKTSLEAGVLSGYRLHLS